ncbi:MAG: hypothetical protein HKN42_03230, partial [Granulosicoccus sp.]|nr:hypothetical protein [Granulosicoccus sp.]
KHFKSKEEIIEEVLRVRFLEEKESDFKRIMDETEGTLLERLSLAYQSFFNGMTATSMKLFQRASYDGMEIAKRYSPHLDERILWPVLEHLRAEAGMPELKLLKPSTAERELALMLHSTIVFIGIRKFVYQIDFHGHETDLIRQHVRIWLDGALANLKEFHDLELP